jgi:hypothetical protein
MRHLKPLAFAIALVPLAVAGAAAQSRPPGKGADACALVSKAEIEQILGLKLNSTPTNPRMQKPGLLSTCYYTGPGGGQVTILIRRNLTKFVPGQERPADEKFREVKGLGAAAFFTDTPPIGTSLNVFRGDYDYILVSGMGLGEPQKVSPGLEKLARLLVERWN